MEGSAEGDINTVAALEPEMRNQAPLEPVTTLFSLPVELRSLIYQDVLDDIIRPPLHPWDELPTPEMYLSLLLVNREINAEVSDLFEKLYVDKLVLYFDNLLRIHWICQNMQRWPVLHSTRFWSRAMLDDTEDDGDAKTDGALMLIDRQPGWKDEWDAHPGWFQTESVNWGGGGDGMSEWKPESHGFKRWTVSHSHCGSKSTHCVPFKKLEFPFMGNDCRVTTYRWRLKGPLDNADIAFWEHAPVDSGAMVFEGRLQDLTFEDVPIKIIRKRMECQRRRKEQGRENEELEFCGCYD